LTPRAFNAAMIGASRRIRRERDLAAWQAWHIAALSRSKRLPSLEKMLGKRGKRQTPREQAAALLHLAGAWGADPEQIAAAHAKIVETIQ